MIPHGIELHSVTPLQRPRAHARRALIMPACIAGAGLAALFAFTPAWLVLCALLPAAGAVLEAAR